MCSAGWVVHALTPASAIDAPISLRNVRRATGSVIASISDGNSVVEMLAERGIVRAFLRACARTGAVVIRDSDWGLV